MRNRISVATPSEEQVCRPPSPIGLQLNLTAISYQQTSVHTILTDLLPTCGQHQIEEMGTWAQNNGDAPVLGKPKKDKGEEHSVLHIKDEFDYQGRSYMHASAELGKLGVTPAKCFLPKVELHTWYVMGPSDSAVLGGVRCARAVRPVLNLTPQSPPSFHLFICAVVLLRGWVLQDWAFQGRVRGSVPAQDGTPLAVVLHGPQDQALGVLRRPPHAADVPRPHAGCSRRPVRQLGLAVLELWLRPDGTTVGHRDWPM